MCIQTFYTIYQERNLMRSLDYNYSAPYLEARHYRKFLLSDVFQINKAYLLAWMVHFNTFRMNGLPYITHPVAMTHIAMDEFHIYDPEVIVTIILHDTGEASIIPFINSGMQLQFGLSNAENNHLLTKTDNNKPVYLSKIIKSGKWRVVLTKLIDRLHNMRTLEDSDVDFQKKQANETRKYFLPLCGELAKVIPNEYEDVPPKIHNMLIILCEQYKC